MRADPIAKMPACACVLVCVYMLRKTPINEFLIRPCDGSLLHKCCFSLIIAHVDFIMRAPARNPCKLGKENKLVSKWILGKTVFSSVNWDSLIRGERLGETMTESVDVNCNGSEKTKHSSTGDWQSCGSPP